MPTPSFDRYHDLSLRVLTVCVLIAMAGSAALLVWRPRTAPSRPSPPSAPVAADALPIRMPGAALTRPLPDPQILMGGNTVFRCQREGRVVYSDQACLQGDEQRLAAPAGGPSSSGTRTALR